MSENTENPASENLPTDDLNVPDKVDVENAGSAIEQH